MLKCMVLQSWCCPDSLAFAKHTCTTISSLMTCNWNQWQNIRTWLCMLQLQERCDSTERQAATPSSISVRRLMTNCVEGKVKLSLCFNWAPRHEGVLGDWRYSATHSLTPALDGGERSASRPGRFTPRERAPGTHWIGGWVGPRAVLDARWREKFPTPPGNRNLEPQSSSPQPSS
jgi:hypothetical protein